MWNCDHCESSNDNSANVCKICGNSKPTNLNKSLEDTKSISSQKKALSPQRFFSIFFVSLAVFTILCASLALLATGISTTLNSGNANPSIVNPYLSATPPKGIIKISTPTEFILSSVLSNTPGMSCPGAPPQRIEVGKRGYVCTQYDRLIIREGPGKNNAEITRLEPGTYFRVIDGPECANNWSWWEIKTDNGIKGWISEGGDSIDLYFICP